MLKDSIRRTIDKLPYVRFLKKRIHDLESSFFTQPGHFYSPLVDKNEMIQHENLIFSLNKDISAVNLNLEEQFQLLEKFKDYYQLLPFTEEEVFGNRYYYNNKAFCHSDVSFLFFMILHFKPKKIIEVGSGFSSGAMLDINEKFFNNSIQLTFIEPYTAKLRSIIKTGDNCEILEKKIQEVEPSFFTTLEENDFLFIDSTHVAKTNSDVLYELFEILPKLKKGVKIHFHDIFFPFEYPKDWIIEQQRNWNEIYILRAFLMYNNEFKILAFNTLLEEKYSAWFKEFMPICMKNKGGSIWLEKL